ncbi:glycosyltransferase [uncultured Desulfovibrio sp.]|uniref:glycosyltransferase n=1 Tax=uncultured Desulfovibrio sp. TaxID=167968 RepID=UPI00260ABEEA|nr:glycosyltransferase [uncultured Desulfovibrio sp.]
MPPVIIAKDLYKCYAGFSPVLRGVNIEVEAGELVAIMGPSGCGKSTMLHVLGMLHAPDAGTLEILGQNVLEFNREQTAAFRRGNMGFVMQASNLFEHSTVFENVEFPLIYENVPPSERWARVIRALDLVRLSARVHYRSNRLSGGEQQRVAIARAMVNNPKILLADEPTGALDAKTSRVVMENFRTLCHSGGVAMIMVTHDPKMAEFCDSVYTLDEGILNCRRRDFSPESVTLGVNLLEGVKPVVRGALLAETFPEPSGRCLMEEAHRMHAIGLLSRIYAVRGGNLLGDAQGYALPLPVRRVGWWRLPAVVRAVQHFRRRHAPPWEALRKSLPVTPGRRLAHLWAEDCGAMMARWGEEDGIDFIYAAGAHSPATAAWIASRLLDLPFAFAVRSADMASPGKDWSVKARDAAFVACDTEDTRQRLRELLPEIPRERLVLLRDPLTLTPPDEDISLPPTGEKEPLRLLAVGTLCARKGFDVLLQACVRLKQQGLDFELRIVGSGPLARRLKWQSWRLGLRKRVIFVGQVPHENMPDLYRRADIFVAPSRVAKNGDYDGLPSALTEAMAFGCAVVASDLPGIREAVQNGESGVIVPPNAAEALGKALLALAAKPEERKRLGNGAFRRIPELLDATGSEARLKELFLAATRQGRPRGADAAPDGEASSLPDDGRQT